MMAKSNNLLLQVAGILIAAAVLSAFGTIGMVIRMDTRQGDLIAGFKAFQRDIEKEHEKFAGRIRLLELSAADDDIDFDWER